MQGEQVLLSEITKSMAEAAEKAAGIAQCCRMEKQLFDLLVEEKKEGEKNKRFVQDFKTLADVLVQETVKCEISKKLPGIGSGIKGEENNHFTNASGEAIDVQIFDSIQETITLLTKVLDGNIDAATVLAGSIYKEVSLVFNTSLIPPNINIPSQSIGIWIDPIDSTSEYIHGKYEKPSEDGLVVCGLQCVCVLIGAYDIQSGIPFLGVVNQPFYSRNSDDTGWQSKYFCGISHEDFKYTSISHPGNEVGKKRVLTSSSESQGLVSMLKRKYEVQFIAGAGYKCLLVAQGVADLYVLSKGSTFFWDTCGPHSLLAAQGGGIVDFQKTMDAQNIDPQKDFHLLQLKYNSVNVKAEGIEKFCNSGGIIAYRDPEVLTELLMFIRQNIF